MKKMLPESELARDERFIRSKIEDRIFDPRGAKIAARNTGPAKMAADRPAAAERSRSLMHGIFVGEIQALEGAGRTCYDFDDDEAPFLYAAACNPDPVLRLTGVNRALEGLAIDVFNSMKEFGESSSDPILTF